MLCKIETGRQRRPGAKGKLGSYLLPVAGYKYIWLRVGRDMEEIRYNLGIYANQVFNFTVIDNQKVKILVKESAK
jgi:hypothetical protein